jgi:hypothetical protein
VKKILLSAAASAAIVLVPASQAYAWTYSLSGSGACQNNGSFKITWTVDNSHENQDMKVTYSSNPSVVAVGTKIPAHKSSVFTQNTDGTKPAVFSLTVKGNWPSDQNQQSHNASVKLDKACAQPTPAPTPTPEPGRGGGTVATPEVTPVAQPAAPQVVTPVGAVDAGNGANGINFAALSGLAGSLTIAGLGLKLRKNR